MRTVVRILAITTLLFVNGPVQATDYYLNPRGDDRNEGTGVDHAWASIDRLNLATLMPGDRIFFEAGARYMGPLLLEPEDRGTDTDPITIMSVPAMEDTDPMPAKAPVCLPIILPESSFLTSRSLEVAILAIRLTGLRSSMIFPETCC